jgi:hypothetical protein
LDEWNPSKGGIELGYALKLCHAFFRGYTWRVCADVASTIRSARKFALLSSSSFASYTLRKKSSEVNILFLSYCGHWECKTCRELPERDQGRDELLTK